MLINYSHMMAVMMMMRGAVFDSGQHMPPTLYPDEPLLRPLKIPI